MHYPHTILDDVVTALEIINHFSKLFCLIYDRMSLFCSLGHSRPGKIQDHHHSLLSRGHGLHFNVWHHQWRILQCRTRLVSYCHYKWRSSSIWKSVPPTAVAMGQWPMYVYHELQSDLCHEAKKRWSCSRPLSGDLRSCFGDFSSFCSLRCFVSINLPFLELSVLLKYK